MAVADPELRLALAIRGGVSLAVWMGGACSEVDSLRRALVAAPSDDGSVGSLYRQLLQTAGYGSVAVDVVAGASAGGLNGALMSCSVVHDLRFDARVRDLWLRLADIGLLSRPVRALPQRSVLDGDGSLFRPLARALQRLGTESGTSAAGGRLDLSLTGTLLDARPSRRHQQVGEAILEPRNRARFRFRRLPMPPSLGLDPPELSDFGTGAQRDSALDLLAYAARSTSSVPGAFEPASVGFAPDSTLPDHRSGIPRSHHGVYSESRPRTGGTGRDQVIDGGVLDDIPVAWAMRSIAGAPANRPVDRWLVYLQPLPFAAVAPRVDETSPVGPLETLHRAAVLRIGSEKLSDDLDELENRRTEGARRSGFTQVIEYAVGPLPASADDPELLDNLFERALAGADIYRRRMNVLETDRVRRLWVDPMPVLGADPLGFTQLHEINSDEQVAVDRSVLLDTLDADDYPGVLPVFPAGGTDSVARRGEVLRVLGRQLRTPQHLARTVALLLSTARLLGERCLDVKGQLYDVRTRIELLIASHDRYLAAEPAVADLRKDSAGELVRRALHRLAVQESPVELDWGSGVPEEGWPQDPFGDLMDQLVSAARELADAARPPAHGVDSGEVPALVRCLLLARASTEAPDEMIEAVLVAVELLTGPLRPDPLTETSPISFHMLSAANQSPLRELRPGGRPLAVDDKLTGNQALSFAAFLSARWRLNDWTWGRLDAAVSLVRIVAAVSRGPDGSTTPELRRLAGVGPGASWHEATDRLVGALHERILREELPLFDVVGVRPPSVDELAGAGTGTEQIDVEPLLAVGKETVAGLVARHPALAGTLVRTLAVGTQSYLFDAVQLGLRSLPEDPRHRLWGRLRRLS